VRKLDRGREMTKPRRRRALRAPRREEPSLLRRLLRWMRPARPMDALAVAVAGTATAAVIVNALLFQYVPHPAPLFAETPKAASPATHQQIAVRTTPASAPPTAGSTPVPQPRLETASIRAKPGLILDLQRGLAERGYYDGELDGLPGPRTQQAIREFEQAHGLNVTGEASEALLARVLQARARGDVTGSVAPPEQRPSTRVLAVQRVLARLGYGPVKLSGLPDPATKSAIENFERDRGLTKSGQVSDRLLKELSTVTGAPVE
jgi:peptidoglycan hydrolase-like protein with peptidoglycan-binding domain